MGIIKTITTDSGVTIDDSYARIDTVNGSKDSLQVSLNYYVNQQAFIEGKGYLAQEIFSFTPSIAEDAANFFKQGYEHLKSLHGFENAIDVLEE